MIDITESLLIRLAGARAFEQALSQDSLNIVVQRLRIWILIALDRDDEAGAQHLMEIRRCQVARLSGRSWGDRPLTSIARRREMPQLSQRGEIIPLNPNLCYQAVLKPEDANVR